MLVNEYLDRCTDILMGKRVINTLNKKTATIISVDDPYSLPGVYLIKYDGSDNVEWIMARNLEFWNPPEVSENTISFSS